jgi:hypothetical protein
MLKKTVIALALPLLFVLVVAASLCRGALGSSPTAPKQTGPAVTTASQSGTFQKMIVENGSVTMDLDLNGFDGSGSLVARPVTLQFLVGANSFFPILVFNDLLRGPQPGSMSLVPVEAAVSAAGVSVSFRRTSATISPCAMATRGSPFLTLKEAITITMPTHNRSTSPMAGFLFQKSLLRRLAAH